MIIMNCLPFLFAGGNYITYVFLLIFTFGLVFRLFGGRETFQSYVKGKRR